MITACFFPTDINRGSKKIVPRFEISMGHMETLGVELDVVFTVDFTMWKAPQAKCYTDYQRFTGNVFVIATYNLSRSLSFEDDFLAEIPTHVNAVDDVIADKKLKDEVDASADDEVNEVIDNKEEDEIIDHDDAAQRDVKDEVADEMKNAAIADDLEEDECDEVEQERKAKKGLLHRLRNIFVKHIPRKLGLRPRRE